MLSFYSPPPLGPAAAVAAAAAAAATNNDDAIQAIDAAFTPFPALPAVAQLPIVLGDLAIALAADSKFVFTPAASLGIMDSVLDTLPTGQLFTKISVENLPDHFRRVVSELVGTATGLAVAKDQGYGLFATVNEINDILGLPNTVQKIWKGHGPDYLVCNAANFDLRLLECKGTSRPANGKPRTFSNYKAQSLNAQLIPPFAINAHLLSYTVVRPGDPLVCRQFNHRPDHVGNNAQARMIIAIAFIHFTTLLSKTQYGWFAVQLREQIRARNTATKIQLPIELRQIRGNFLIEGNAVGIATLAIDLAAEALFEKVAEGEWLTDDNVALELSEQIGELSTKEGQLRQAALSLDWQLARITTSAVGILFYQL